MRRIGYLRWAAPLLAAALLSGCAVVTKKELKPVPATLTHGRLVYLADHACAADLQYDRRLKTPTNPEAFVKYLRLSIKSGEHLLFILRGLAPPPSEVAAFPHLLAAENGADLVANHFLDEYGDMTVHRFKHLVRRSRILDRRIHIRAKRLGMDVCAKD